MGSAMLRFVVFLLLAAWTGCVDVKSKKLLPDLSEGLSCHIDEIVFLHPTECVGLDEEGWKVKNKGYCRIGGGSADVSIDLEILRDGILTCDDGRWSGTRSSVGESRHRQKRFWGFVVGFVACYLFCGRGGGGGGTQVIYKYPPTFPDPCTPANIQPYYYVDAGKTSVFVTWTPPTASDRDGGNPSVVQVGGGSNGGSFDGSVSGKTHYITYKATDADGLTANCYFSFTVTILTCSSLPWPDNGKRECENSNVLGSTCRYACDVGYVLTGSSTVTCQSKASPTWSSIPTCNKIKCTAPVSPNHGTLQCKDSNYEYQAICGVSCNDGFRLQGPTYMQCREDGTWSGTGSTRCVDDTPPTINCITPQVFYADRGVSSVSVTWKLPTTLDNTDSSPSIHQTAGPNRGSVLQVGSTAVKYKASDSNGNQSPECTIEIRVEEITCGHPLDTLNDSYIRFSCSNTRYTYGTVCNLSCTARLPLEGTNLLTCESDDQSEGVWDWGTGTKPFCREIACPELDPPINGLLVYDTVLTRPQYTMMCNNKYDIPDMGSNFNGLFFCTDRGDWTPYADVPDCIKSRSPRLLSLPSEIFYYRGDCGTSDTLTQVKDNFQKILDQGLNPYFSAICPRSETCRAENIKVKCGPIQGRKKRAATSNYKSTDLVRTVREIKVTTTHRVEKRQSQTHLLVVEFDITVELVLQNRSLLDVIDYYDNITLNLLKPVVQEMVNNGTFDIAGSTLKSDSFQTPDYGDISCDPGYMLDRTICKPCPLGYQLNETSSRCQKCPIGEYRDNESTANCTTCPVGYSTKATGSKSLNECIKLCAPGSYSPDTMESCSPCVQSYYQDEHGQTSCKRCPSGTTTSLTNSTSSLDCQYFDVLLERTDGGLTVTTVSSSLSALTWMFWTKRLDGNDTNTVLRLTSSNGDLIVVYLTDNIRVQIPSKVDQNVGTLTSSSWSHVAVVWDTSVTTVKVYVNGVAVHTNNAVTSPSPLLQQGGGFIVTSTGSSGVYLTGLHLLNTALDQGGITSHATSCHVVLQTDLLNMAIFDGLTKQGITLIKSSNCDAVDECRSSPCNGHLCINGQDSYRCVCSDGWSGNQCTVPPDFCVGNQCENGATCHSLTSNYSCTCLPGYRGSFCKIPPVDGAWSSWSVWSECSKTCGSGTQFRTRACDSPAPGPYGRSCAGNSTEQTSCNTDICPECKPFVRKYGTLFNCSTNSSTGRQTCTAYCQDGMAIPPGLSQFQEFTCGPETDYEWSPIHYTLPCVGPVGPRELTVVAPVVYSSTIPVREQSAVRSAIESNLQSTACGTSSNCSATVTFSNARKRSSGTTVTLTFTIPLSLGPDLQYSNFISTGTVNGALQELSDALSALEMTAQYLQNYTSRAFDVTSGSVTYTVDTSSLMLTPTVTCTQGQAAQDAVCYECPAGTYLSNNVCAFCEKGTYQTVTGQSSCVSCPAGFTTPTIGSAELSHCSEPATTTSTSPTTQKDDDDDEGANRGVSIAIGISVSAFVLASVAIVIAVWYKVIRPKSRLGGSVSDFKRDKSARQRFPRSYSRDLSTLSSRPTTPARLDQISFDTDNDHIHDSDESRTPVPLRSGRDASRSFDNGGYLTPAHVSSPPPPYTPPMLPRYTEKDAGFIVDIDRKSTLYDTIPDSDKLKY